MDGNRRECDQLGNLFQALSHPIRRAVVQVVEHDGTDPTDVESLCAVCEDVDDVDRLSGGSSTANGTENAPSLDDPSVSNWNRDRERTALESAPLETALHHHHLPKLASVDVIEYDLQSRTVTSGDNGDLAADLLQTVAGEPDGASC
ncbi:DUF7344 domain-containing protein [Natronolimnohabitans innermongolicus]|uniref:DUF7344 domain-containing protein n=1 Tax=Natronolimnohabitans innermongolicus JCM 12255 TaxID=1227499 RepID=L9WKA7_9EURY|nr:hypothetical protein [Natronolimnohabitans innermongolicus]ELY49631.1 hypothetical protein C493_20080 [Natronolimnohabitans innermongolicus JCM 12255]